MVLAIERLRISWWKLPAISGEYQKIIPDFWSSMYPITYYFLGCYLKEFGLKIKKNINAMFIVLLTVVFGTYSYWRSYGSIYDWGSWCDWYSLFVVIQTVLVFGLIINFDFSKMPNKIRYIFKFVSELTLGAYLVSYIFDDIFYRLLNTRIQSVPHKLEYYGLVVPVIYICSMILSFVIEKIYTCILFLYNQLIISFNDNSSR